MTHGDEVLERIAAMLKEAGRPVRLDELKVRFPQAGVARVVAA